MTPLAHFVRALGYFTTIPIPHESRSAPTSDEVAWLPLIGALLGAVSGALARAAASATSDRVGAAIAYGAPIVLSGALHLDGFLDVCDAMFAPVGPQRRTEILRDPHHGTFAAAGLSVTAIGAYAALREITPARWPVALALSEAVGRAAAVVAARVVERADTGTAARAFERPPSTSLLGLQLAMLGALAYRHGGARSVVAASLALASAPFAASAIARQFDGKLTGDGYGFLITAYTVTMLGLCTLD